MQPSRAKSLYISSHSHSHLHGHSHLASSSSLSASSNSFSINVPSSRLVLPASTGGSQKKDLDGGQSKLDIQSLSLRPHKQRVLYWMFREMRAEHNWALLHAQNLAKERDATLGVIYCHVSNYARYTHRHYHFQIESMKLVQAELKKNNIPLILIQNQHPDSGILDLIKSDPSVDTTLIIDFLPVREFLQWTHGLVSHPPQNLVEIIQVDGHNLIPAWVASSKLEYAARSLRTKILSLLPEYLDVETFPNLETMPIHNISNDYQDPQWDKLDFGDQVINTNVNTESPSVSSLSSSLSSSTLSKQYSTSFTQLDQHFPPGAAAAHKSLISFLSPIRLGQQATKRNDPNAKDVCSRLSPYINFGIISTQFIAQKVKEFMATPDGRACAESIHAYLEEMIIRRELADNFCLYQQNYDNMLGCASWAKETLLSHANDKRDYIYTFEQLENAQTHDDLWNAAQIQMKEEGLMHGYIRMYWAKKILEWTESPMVALDYAIRLNDKYSLDANNNPSAYIGCMWAICGVHDQGWTERKVTGKIRIINLATCKTQFDVEQYMSRYIESSDTEQSVDDVEHQEVTSSKRGLSIPSLSSSASLSTAATAAVNPNKHVHNRQQVGSFMDGNQSIRGPQLDESTRLESAKDDESDNNNTNIAPAMKKKKKI